MSSAAAGWSCKREDFPGCCECICSTEGLVLTYGAPGSAGQQAGINLLSWGFVSFRSVLKPDPLSPVPCHSRAVCLCLLPACEPVSCNDVLCFCDHFMFLKKSRSACSQLLFGDWDGRDSQKSTDKYCIWQLGKIIFPYKMSILLS